jgi:hypothetical protein
MISAKDFLILPTYKVEVPKVPKVPKVPRVPKVPGVNSDPGYF